VPATLNRLPALKSNSSPEPGNLIDQLLAEQKKLQTPVAKFSEVHHRREPDLADHYRTLIPLSKPGSGEQYAFEVTLDRCTGCKACVSACHSLNGLDDEEVWRDVGTLLGGKSAPGWQQTVTTACHHCEDPGCLNGCPVGAYEKDADTGIVRHLDDQCIGCSYCILKCPYDVPKYSKKRGIVRKCDMCHQRLAEGEAPACVQACPTEAIRIVKVTQGQLNPQLFGSDIEHVGSSLPSSKITRPTTRYVGREVPQTAVPSDQVALIPQHAHWPLIFMLVFTQAGIGLILTSATTSATLIGAVIFYAGMVASVFHLGQPLKAWRFFIGLRTSWLSREILAFSMFAPLPFALSAIPFLPDFPFKSLAVSMLTLPALPLGLLAVFTSVMIYHDTHRSLWRFPLGACRFFGTVSSFSALSLLIANPADTIVQIAFACSILIKLSPEIRLLMLGISRDTAWTADVHSARLQLGPLSHILRCRMAFALVGLVMGVIQPWLGLPILLLAEVFERQLFFQAVQAPKMPGNFGPHSKHG
jgi:formate dehydrogenase iron-sulfur subunit